MKKLHFQISRLTNASRSHLSMLLLSLVILLSGCASSIEDFPTPNDYPITTASNASSNVTKEDAITIANKVLKKNDGRSDIMNLPSFEYVVSGNSTRSISTVDTLAYVLNYPNDAGFVIVSTDRRVYPVLGFSYEGNFSFENDNAKSNFIDNIEAYLESATSNDIYDVTDNDFDGCYEVNPMIQISLSQRSPWDKYVIQEHPNCPVGCVAVATALVMCHSKKKIVYHNSTFYLEAIVTAISNGPSSTPTFPPIQPACTYDQAVDFMAKILYWIGKDVNMNYSPDGSGAFSSNAYNLCKSLNYIIPSGLASFDIKKITQYLNENYIIYLSGSDINGKGGHAWVSDACYFCVDINDPSQILDTYIHCDWGWGGYCNGFYSGSVFAASTYNFKPNSYFAIKREW